MAHDLDDRDEDEEQEEDYFPKLDEKFKLRFEKKFRRNDDGCWVWQASKDADGYGQVRVLTGTKGIKRAHRISYELYKQERIEPGFDIDHTCHVRECVSPEHLEVVTHTENMRRIKSVKQMPWAMSQKQFEARKTTPEIMLEDAKAILVRSEIPEPVTNYAAAAEGQSFAIATLDDAPWRALSINDGFIGKTAYSRLKIFLDCVRFGVNWKTACREILCLSPFTLSNSQWLANTAWRDDFLAAKKEGRKTRYSDLEDLHLDELERKIDMADFKEIADSLKKLREQDEERIAIRRGNEQSGGPNITFIIGGPNPEKALRTVVEIGDTLEAEYQVLPESE